MRATRRRQVHVIHCGRLNRRGRKLVTVRWPVLRAAMKKMLVDMTVAEDAGFWDARHLRYCSRRGRCDCERTAP